MKLLEKVNWDTLNVYINNNLIVANKHLTVRWKHFHLLTDSVLHL